jgi:hypothetical protein
MAPGKPGSCEKALANDIEIGTQVQQADGLRAEVRDLRAKIGEQARQLAAEAGSARDLAARLASTASALQASSRHLQNACDCMHARM